MTKEAVLVLESGRVFRGQAFGADTERFGEVVFNTSLTGYQEILTDPSYAGQIVVMTPPQIGNTGVTAWDEEANAPACAGLCVRELSPVTSSWRSEDTLDGFMKKHGLAGIQGIDTRALTRAIRDGGAQRGAISARRTADIEGLLKDIQAWPKMEGQDLAKVVTCKEQYAWDEGCWVAPDEEEELPAAKYHVVAYDFGIKKNILRNLRQAGCKVTVLPAETPVAVALDLKADGYFLSNGPGDPAAVTYGVEVAKAVLDSGKPVFGICLGFQILCLALGGKTYKLPFGHHGGNHPVKDLTTEKVEITAQNHGFAVDRESLAAVGAEVTHINLYDDTVAGFALKGKPVFGVQYHPEASPGPHDANYLFDRFVKLMA